MGSDRFREGCNERENMVDMKKKQDKGLEIVKVYILIAGFVFILAATSAFFSGWSHYSYYDMQVRDPIQKINYSKEVAATNNWVSWPELPTYYGQEPYRNLSDDGFAYFMVADKAHGTVIVSCKTRSMYPELTCNDTVLMIPKTSKHYGNTSIGDVIVFSSQDRSLWGSSVDFVMHRVIGIDYDENGTVYYITKGDNNEYADLIKTYDRHIRYKVIGKWK